MEELAVPAKWDSGVRAEIAGIETLTLSGIAELTDPGRATPVQVNDETTISDKIWTDFSIKLNVNPTTN